MSCCVSFGYPTGRWGVAPRRPVHEVSYRNQWGSPGGIRPRPATVAAGVASGADASDAGPNPLVGGALWSLDSLRLQPGPSGIRPPADRPGSLGLCVRPDLR